MRPEKGFGALDNQVSVGEASRFSAPRKALMPQGAAGRVELADLERRYFLLGDAQMLLERQIQSEVGVRYQCL